MDAIDPRVLALAVPMVLGLVEVAKSTGMPTRYAGLAAVTFGAFAGLLIRVAGVGEGNANLAVLTGVVAGLMAAGVWSGAKALTPPKP